MHQYGVDLHDVAYDFGLQALNERKESRSVSSWRRCSYASWPRGAESRELYISYRIMLYNIMSYYIILYYISYILYMIYGILYIIYDIVF